MMGMDKKHARGWPHIISPITTPKTVISALILTFDPTTSGSNTLLSTKCVNTRVMITNITLLATVAVANVMSVLMMSAVKMPI